LNLNNATSLRSKATSSRRTPSNLKFWTRHCGWLMLAAFTAWLLACLHIFDKLSAGIALSTIGKFHDRMKVAWNVMSIDVDHWHDLDGTPLALAPIYRAEITG